MSTFLVVLWVIGVIAILIGLIFALMAMNWATRGNIVETLFETTTMSAAILFYAFNNSDFTRTIFDKVYEFIRMCMGLKDTDIKFVPNIFNRGELDWSIKLVIGIVLVGFFIRYIVSADEKLMALAFLPLMLLIEIIFILALPDRFIVTLLPFFGTAILAVLIFSGFFSGSSSGSTKNPAGSSGSPIYSDGTPTYSDGTPIDPFAYSGTKTYHSLKNGNEYIQQVAEYPNYVILRDEHGNTFNATKGHDGMVYDSNGNYYRSNDI